MSTQQQRAEHFFKLHQAGSPLVLFNVWDPGSAQAVAASGAFALATGSWSVAAAHGFGDGEKLPLSLVLDNLQRIVSSTTLPVSVDLESGYGADSQALGDTISRAIAAGAIGCNLEDSDATTGTIRPAQAQQKRLLAARAAAASGGIPFFLNARTDLFLQAGPEQHDATMLNAAIERARIYADSGASGVFVPGLANAGLIERMVSKSPLPVNVMVSSVTPTLAQLAELGVARVSHGPGPYRAAMKALEVAARAAMRGQT
jgi:2-methylisocitrate lyase-like PEP mutase family enzyme